MEEKIKQLEQQNLELKKQLFALNYKELVKQFNIEIIPSIFFETEDQSIMFDNFVKEKNIKFKLDLTLKNI